MQSIKPQHKEPTAKPQAVIYEVNLSVDVEVIERFDEWLHKHTEEMLAIPGFISAATSVPDVDDENQKHRCVQYRLSDQAALDNYLEHYAEEMRAKSLQHFEGHFTAKRRVLSLAEAALAKHGVCANCGAELLGRFCNVCGQREEPRVPTIGSITSEFTNEVFVVESKLWRSFCLLLFKPGQLTMLYLSGMRQKYMSPLRLYLLFSIITFAYFSLLNSQGSLGIDIETAPDVEVTEEVSNEVAELNSQEEETGFNSRFFSDEVNAEIEQRIKGAVTSIKSDIEAGNKQAVVNKFVSPLPKALFLFLPIVALLFKILYLGSGKYYVEHLIYVLHNHAFLFAVIILTTIISQVARLWPRFEVFIGIGLLLGFSVYAYRYQRKFLIEKFSKSRVKAVLYLCSMVVLLALFVAEDGISLFIVLLWSIYVPFYIYRSMRVVYQRPPWVTAASFAVISMMYLFLLVVMLLSSAAFVGYTYS